MDIIDLIVEKAFFVAMYTEDVAYGYVESKDIPGTFMFKSFGYTTP